jgi:hypothetical protein
MKDIVIRQVRIKREFLVLSVCFVAAILLNVYAIATRGTEWSELFTQLHITLALALFFYVVLSIVRLGIFGAKRLVGSGR